MNARGTRRPHPRRVRSKPVRVTRRAGKAKGCAVLVLAFAGGLTAVADAVWWLIA